MVVTLKHVNKSNQKFSVPPAGLPESSCLCTLSVKPGKGANAGGLAKLPL